MPATMNDSINIGDDDDFCWNHARLQRISDSNESNAAAATKSVNIPNSPTPVKVTTSSPTSSSNHVSFQTPADTGKKDKDEYDPRAQFLGKSKKGGVRFPSKEDVLNERFDISRLSTYELDEIIAVWGDADEKANRKQNMKEDMKILQKAQRRMSDNGFTAIGLLDKIGERRNEKRNNRERGKDTVLSTQETQRRLKELDCCGVAIPGVPESCGGGSDEDYDEVLAKLYKATVKGAQDKAYEEALALHNDIVYEEKHLVRKQKQQNRQVVASEILKVMGK